MSGKSKQTRNPITSQTANQSRSRRPQTTSKSGKPKDPLRDWDAWVAEITKPPRQPLANAEFALTADNSPLLWGVAADSIPGKSGRLVEQLHSLSAHHEAWNGQTIPKVESWLDSCQQLQPTLANSIACLAWSHALPALASLLPEVTWRRLLDQLASIAGESSAISCNENPVEAQLLGGELPLTLGCLFPELPQCRRLWKSGAASLCTAIREQLDGEGMPRSDQLQSARLLLACWTRCRILERCAGQNAFTASARRQYVWMVRQSLRLTRPDGTACLWHGSGLPWPDALLQSALEFAQDPACNAMARVLSPEQKKPTRVSVSDLPAPSVESEWSQIAILRSQWSRPASQFTVAYSGQTVQCELNVHGQNVWSGPWTSTVSLNDRDLALASDWQQVCWSADEDGDYLELQAELAEGGTVQRQMFLAREDSFLLLAEAYLGKEPDAIRYRSCLPVASGLSFASERETHEGLLQGRRRIARVLPLALPEWRAAGNAGSLEFANQALQWRFSKTGRHMFVPVFLDLDPKRLVSPMTWRHLTVAERLVIQNSDTAVGYRVQVGDRHWLVYRALDHVGNRTVLGQNYSSEFVVARIPREGEAKKLIEVE